MQDKISPVAVVKEAVAVSWARKWTFLGLVVVSMLPVFLQFGFLAAPGQGGGALFFLIFVVQIGALLFIATTVNHLAVTIQRGRGKVFPERFWNAIGRVFVRGLVLMLTILGIEIICMIPIVILVFFSLPGDGNMDHMPMAAMAVLGVGGVAMTVLVWGAMLRLSIMIPAAAADRVVTIREALALTKGHTWRMFGSLLILILPVFAFIFIFVLLFAGGLAMGGAGVAGGIVSFLLMFIVQVFVGIVWMAMIAVWYEKLRLRMAGPETEFEFAPEAAPESSSSYVGPYADMSSE